MKYWGNISSVEPGMSRFPSYKLIWSCKQFNCLPNTDDHKWNENGNGN